MNKRRLLIITTLLHNEEKLPTLPDLAEEYKVSQRTIRNDIRLINEFLLLNHLGEITIKSGILYLPPYFKKVKDSLEIQSLYAYKLSSEERVAVACIFLIDAQTFITLQSISEKLFVSRATVIGDLVAIKDYLKSFQLELVSHPNKGVRISGLESCRRECILQFLNQHSDNSLLLNYLSLQEKRQNLIEKVVYEVEKNYRIEFTDYSFATLIQYLSVMIVRNRKGEYIELCSDSSEMPETYLFAQDILRFLSNYCQFKTSESEIEHLSHFIATLNYTKQLKTAGEAVSIQLLTRSFISNISKDLGINLNDDYLFFENLSNHLENVLNSHRIVYPQNSILDEVIEANQEVLAVVKDNIHILRSYSDTELNDIDVAYITIHICASIERKKNQEIPFHIVLACHAGIGTSYLLLEKLKQHFKFNIVDIISAHEAEVLKAGAADLIISTVPLKQTEIDFVTVNSIFNDEDYIKVGNKIDTLRNSKYLPEIIPTSDLSARGLLDILIPIIERYGPEQSEKLIRLVRKSVRDYFNESIEEEAEIFSPYLHHLLPTEHVQLNVEAKTWKEAIQASAQPLLEAGYINSEYVTATIKSIEENGPYIVLAPGFAIPHGGLNQGSLKVGMNLIRLKEPVLFHSDEFDPVRYVCCMSAIDNKMHLKAFFHLVNMLEHRDFLDALDSCQTSQEVSNTILEYEYLYQDS